MNWIELLKAHPQIVQEEEKEEEQASPMSFIPEDKEKLKDTDKDFDIGDFPSSNCAAWPHCNKEATWACIECGAQWCDEHKDSGMDGHNNMVSIGGKAKDKEEEGRYHR